MADIAGFTRPQIEAFSTRRRQAEEWRQNQGLPDTVAARQAAVLATRDPKQERRLQDLRLEWQQRAAEVGLTPERVASITGRSWEVTPADLETLYEYLASPDGLTAKASTFATAEVVKAIAGSLPEGGTRDEIEALAGSFLATRDVVPLLPRGDVESPDVVEPETLNETVVGSGAARMMRRRDGTVFPSPADHLYTTTELLATEQRIIEHALDGVGAGRWIVPGGLVEADLRRHRHLTDGQHEMVRRFATSGNVVTSG
jgi:hypothetical protein